MPAEYPGSPEQSSSRREWVCRNTITIYLLLVEDQAECVPAE